MRGRGGNDSMQDQKDINAYKNYEGQKFIEMMLKDILRIKHNQTNYKNSYAFEISNQY